MDVQNIGYLGRCGPLLQHLTLDVGRANETLSMSKQQSLSLYTFTLFKEEKISFEVMICYSREEGISSTLIKNKSCTCQEVGICIHLD